MRVGLLMFTLALATPVSAKPKEIPTPPPLVRRNIAPPPIVQTVRESVPTWEYASWKASDYGTFTMASTVNESESAFGMVCGQDCVWFVNFGIECTEGHKYPAMINSPAGSYAIQLRCYHLGDRRLLTFAMDDASLGLFEKPGEAGFAIPLESGKFQVSRFSLAGGADAVSKALNLVMQRRNANQEGLRDFTI